MLIALPLQLLLAAIGAATQPVSTDQPDSTHETVWIEDERSDWTILAETGSNDDAHIRSKQTISLDAAR